MTVVYKLSKGVYYALYNPIFTVPPENSSPLIALAFLFDRSFQVYVKQPLVKRQDILPFPQFPKPKGRGFLCRNLSAFALCCIFNGSLAAIPSIGNRRI